MRNIPTINHEHIETVVNVWKMCSPCHRSNLCFCSHHHDCQTAVNWSEGTAGGGSLLDRAVNETMVETVSGELSGGLFMG